MIDKIRRCYGCYWEVEFYLWGSPMELEFSDEANAEQFVRFLTLLQTRDELMYGIGPSQPGVS